MTQNMDHHEREHLKKTDPSTWTAYGDPLENESSSAGEAYQKEASPMLEKAKEDGNIVKKE